MFFSSTIACPLLSPITVTHLIQLVLFLETNLLEMVICAAGKSFHRQWMEYLSVAQILEAWNVTYANRIILLLLALEDCLIHHETQALTMTWALGMMKQLPILMNPISWTTLHPMLQPVHNLIHHQLLLHPTLPCLYNLIMLIT